MLGQYRQPASAARWSNRSMIPAQPTANNSLGIDAGFIQELETMAQTLKLGEPMYKIAGGTSSGRGYFCSVHVGAHQAGSLDEYVTQEQAKCAAAKNAVNVLKTYYGNKWDRLKNASSAAFSMTTTMTTANGPFGAGGFTKNGNSAAGTASASQSTNSYLDLHDSTPMFERIVENLLVLLMDKRKRHGVYSHALADEYLKTFNEELPSDWLARIKDGYPEIEVNEVDETRSIVAKRLVKTQKAPIGIAASKPLNTEKKEEFEEKPNVGAGECQSELPKATSTPPPTPVAAALSPRSESSAITMKEEEPTGVAPNKSIDETTIIELSSRLKKIGKVRDQALKVQFADDINEKSFCAQDGESEWEIIVPPEISNPPPFSPPEFAVDNRWQIFVSVVKTPADFMVRVIGEEHSEQYDQLQRDMHSYYELARLGRQIVIPQTTDGNGKIQWESLIGNVFAARAEECWHRVYLHDIIAADEGIAGDVVGSVYFIDHGDYETIPLADLCQLEQRFMRVPCQAICACLSGFEHLSADEFTIEMLDRFREITLAKVLWARYLKNLDVVSSGDSSASAIGAYVLQLDMPPPTDENNEVLPSNGAGAEADGTDQSTSNIEEQQQQQPISITDVIMQIAPERVIDKIIVRRQDVENGKAASTPATVMGQK